ncbi:unnamed protein product [Protopolystoma xenopodis]|uniref:Uncharacterized protein n=1 Tax=Protopolystoma xenopodis TaxID=117903 RepID=A0A448XJA0_9PLAT|nr:unnamed protein product [Protopolystoma xenopodis]
MIRVAYVTAYNFVQFWKSPSFICKLCIRRVVLEPEDGGLWYVGQTHSRFAVEIASLLGTPTCFLRFRSAHAKPLSI